MKRHIKGTIARGLLLTMILGAAMGQHGMVVRAEATETVVETTSEKETETETETLAAEATIELGTGADLPVYQAEEEKKMVFRLTNTGKGVASNVNITPVIGTDTAGWPFEVSSTDYEQAVGEIAAGQTVDVAYSFKARGDVKSSDFGLKFRITYDTAGRNRQEDKTIFVRMVEKVKPKETVEATTTVTRNEDAPAAYFSEPTPSDGGGSFSNGNVSQSSGGTSTSVPRVIVTGFRTEPGEVKAGTDFKLIVKLKNTSKKTEVKNMLYTFSAPTGGKDETASAAFLPSSGANSIYMDGMKAGEEKEVAIDLNAKADLVQKPYSIEMGIKYEDKDGAQFDAASSVSIPIKQESRFEFSEIQVNPGSIAIGEEANISTNLYNLGRTKLYNVKAKIEGDGASSQESFVGNVESGATAAIDIMVTGKKETKEGKMKLIVTYEDSDGKAANFEKEMSLTVTKEEAEMVMEMPEESPKGFPLPLLIGALVIGIAAVVSAVLYKRRKKSEENIDDELSGYIEDERE